VPDLVRHLNRGHGSLYVALVVEFIPKFLPGHRSLALSFKSLEHRTRVEQGSVTPGHLQPPDVFKAEH
jgi:hypothetical protein